MAASVTATRATISASPPFVLRVRVGVTGHRSLPDPEAIARRVDEVLDELATRLSPSGRTPVVYTAVSPLADGADRIVAEAVLTRGGELWAPLPLPAAPRRSGAVSDRTYDADFDTASRAKFHDLLKQASWSRLVSHRERPDAYDDVGRYVVDHSDVVIAIWNRQAAAGKGGTGEIVACARERKVALVIIPTDGSETEYDLRLPWVAADDVDHLNGSAIAQRDKFLADERGYRGPTDEGDASRVTALCDWILPPFVQADRAAVAQQETFFRVGIGISVCAALAVTFATLHALFLPDRNALVAAELASLVAGIALVIYAKRQRLHPRWLAYRALAERLRSAYFLAAAGCRDEPVPDPERNADDVAWVVDAANGVWADRPVEATKVSDSQQARDYLVARWIDSQAGYHERAAEREKGRHNMVKAAVVGAIGLAIVAAGIHLLDAVGVLQLELESEHRHNLAHTLAALAIIPPAWAAAFTAIGEQREWRRNAEAFARMHERLGGVRVAFGRVSNHDGLVAIAHYGDSVMRAENEGWFGLMQAREPELTA